MGSLVRIVLAGGDPTKRAALGDVLGKVGCVAIGGARYGKQVVSLVRKLAPDLVIIDVDNVSGLPTAIKQITEARLAPVLLLSEFNLSKIEVWAKSFGVFGYVAKPIDERAVFPAIQVALRRWQEIKSLENELSELKDTLAARKLLDKAKGILMKAHNLSEAESYRRIQKYAMTRRTTIKRVAEAIIRAAEGRNANV